MKKITAFLAVSLTLFFGRMLFLGYGYYYGDFKIQHYPWAMMLDQCLKHFSLPLWVPGIGCGFPLLAEGQVGALDPLNVVAHLLLTPDTAYSAVFIMAFFLCGLFIYLLSRKEGMSEWAGVVSSGTFLFGSAYAGLIYGPAALRCFVWLPAGLYFSEGLVGGNAPRRTIPGLALCIGASFLSGYPQAAFYHLIAYLLFIGLCLFFEKKRLTTKTGIWLIMAIIAGIGFAAVQIFPTLELMSFSNRFHQSAVFALSGSFNPLGISALFWPSFGKFTAHDFYIGILPLLFLGISILSWKQDARVRVWSVFSLFFICAGFGKFNPIYDVAIRVSRFYFFRFPCKFMLYALFGFSMLAGSGWDTFWRCAKNAGRQKAEDLVKGMAAVAVMVYAAAHLVARTFQGPIISCVKSYVRNSIFQKEGHVASLDEYFSRISVYFEIVLRKTAWNDVHFLISLVFWGLALFISLTALRLGRKKILIAGFFLLMLMDWYHHAPSGTGLWGNCVPKSTVAADNVSRVLSDEKGLFRAYEYVSDPLRPPRWQVSSNLLFGYSSIGLYSPLAISSYKDYTHELAVVDDAAGRESISELSLAQHLNRLRWMNVKYLISSSKLRGIEGIHLLTRSSQDYLYTIADFKPRAFLTAKGQWKDNAVFMDENKLIAEDCGTVERVRYQDHEIQIAVRANTECVLWLSELYYPGWKATINGRSEPIYRANGIFRAVKLEKGHFDVRFRYEPGSFYWGLVISGLSLLSIVLFYWRGDNFYLKR